jgi:hypothetical protein
MEPQAREEEDGYGPSAKPAGADTAAIEIGEITAWRLWRLGNDGFVYSPIINLPWRPGEVMRSFPHLRADDGIYASKTRPQMMWPPSARASWPLVVGRVSLWGTVIEHEKGYRAENARILAFDDIVSWSSFDTQKALALLSAKYFRRWPARYRPRQ